MKHSGDAKMWTAALAASAGLLVAGCGSGSSGSSTATSATAKAVATRSPAGPQRPKIAAPKGPEPKRVVAIDLRRGSGRKAKRGEYVAIRYVGINWNGSLYANSWAYEKNPEFRLGTLPHQLSIAGLEKGILGMRVGGRRKVLIPRSARFWPDERPGYISPHERGLVYVVDLIGVRKKGAPPVEG